MYTVRKEFKFEAAHVLDKCYSEECKFIHGHSYKVEVFVGSSTLNEDGMVVDFKKLKEIVSPLIDAWDHRLIGTAMTLTHWFQPVQVMVVVKFNPTAENMSHYLFDKIQEKLKEIHLGYYLKVRVWETATSYAEFSERW